MHLTSNYFDHLSLDTPTYLVIQILRASSRIFYYGHSAQYSYLVWLENTTSPALFLHHFRPTYMTTHDLPITVNPYFTVLYVICWSSYRSHRNNKSAAFSQNVPWSYWCLSLTACRSNENRNWFILSLICWANISRALLERPVIASGSHSDYDLQCLERCTVFNFLWARTIHFAMLFKWLWVNSAFTINTRWVCYLWPILECRGTSLLLTVVYFDKSVDVCVNIFLHFMSISECQL